MPTERRDYYAVLGTSPNADAKAIKDAFRNLARKYHPDRNKEPGAEEKFKEIVSAYAVLSDPEKRKAYDARGFAGVAGLSEDEMFQSVDFGDVLAGLGLDLGGIGFGPGRAGSLFDSFLRGRRAEPPRGRDVEVCIEIPLSRVITGGQEEVSYLRSVPCRDCQGTGAKDGAKLHRCAVCEGTGRRVQESRRRQQTGEVLVRSISECPECRGRGQVIDESCPSCNGLGVVDEKKSLTVKVPAGVEEGTVLRIPRHGMPSDQAPDSPGDLFVIVRSAPEPRFERHGADLWCREEISVAEAVLGTTKAVAALDGSIDVTVPAGAQPGLVLRLAGRGLPRFGRSGRGDLYVRVDVRIPDKPSKREHELYEKLRELESHGEAQPSPAARRRS